MDTIDYSKNRTLCGKRNHNQTKNSKMTNQEKISALCITE